MHYFTRISLDNHLKTDFNAFKDIFGNKKFFKTPLTSVKILVWMKNHTLHKNLCPFSTPFHKFDLRHIVLSFKLPFWPTLHFLFEVVFLSSQFL
jgi:hypothetical protein